MKRETFFTWGLLDLDAPNPTGKYLWRAMRAAGAREINGGIVFVVPFQKVNPKGAGGKKVPGRVQDYDLVVTAYGESVIRTQIVFEEKPAAYDEFKALMLELDSSVAVQSLSLEEDDREWRVVDGKGRLRMRVGKVEDSFESDQDGAYANEPNNSFVGSVAPDGGREIAFMTHDVFGGEESIFSVPMGMIRDDHGVASTYYALACGLEEKFAGGGERFTTMNLAGKTIDLTMIDGLGSNSNRSYKNVPFYLSSKGYGLFMNTSAHIRMSWADMSTNTVQARVDDTELDLFFVGGENPERIVFNYRCLTGFPRSAPLWSYGLWLSKCMYQNRGELEKVADTMRERDLPFDVLNVDAWQPPHTPFCWSEERFPEAKAMIESFKKRGVRFSVWTSPDQTLTDDHYEDLCEEGHVVPGSQYKDWGAADYSVLAKVNATQGYVDFTRPETVEWWKDHWREALATGIVAVKTDFAEDIDVHADFANMPARWTHNLYPLLYEKATYEALVEVHGAGNAVLWARSGWAGCQRYPLHWGGDTAATWYGLAGVIRGGLHLGVSGFSFWSHDAGGFLGIPSARGSQPSDALYVRWTQAAVMSSHMRYHGASQREPYAFPGVEDIVRDWLRLRYALIPYLLDESQKSISSGFPVLRALLFHHPDDPTVWDIDHQYYLGEHLLVAPVLNEEGIRDIYLPEGRWIDLFTGESVAGGRWLLKQKFPLERMPVYARAGAVLKLYPERVTSTNDMDLSKTIEVTVEAGTEIFGQLA